MDIDFERRQKRLEKEQSSRRSHVLKKLESKAVEDVRHQVTSALSAEQASRVRRDRAEAEERAREERERDAILGGGVLLSKTLKVRATGTRASSGNRITVPVSLLEDLEKQGAAFPIHFQLTRPEKPGESGPCTHVGVLEFSAGDGEAVVTDSVLRTIGLDENHIAEDQMVKLKYVRLPKGKSATFAALSDTFFDIPDHRSMLEQSLRSSYASLSKGDVLVLPHATGEQRVAVVSVEPDVEGLSAVSIIDTDLAVDIHAVSGGVANSAPHNSGGEGASEPKLGSSSSESAAVQLIGPDQTVNGHVIAGAGAGSLAVKYYKFSVMDSEGLDKITVQVDLGTSRLADSSADVSLFVASAGPSIHPGPGHHDWLCTDSADVKRVSINGILPGVYYVGVHAYTGRANYTVKIERTAKNAGDVDGGGSGPIRGGVGLAQCDNCLQYVPLGNLAMHSLHCARNTFRCKIESCGVVLHGEDATAHVHCPICQMGMLTRDQLKHSVVHHTPITCGGLGCNVVAADLEALVVHRRSECVGRMVTCRFCGDLARSGAPPSDAKDRLQGLTEHEALCGSRTAPCETCRLNVRLKEMDVHRMAYHGDITASAKSGAAVSTPAGLAALVGNSTTVNEASGGAQPWPMTSPGIAGIAPTLVDTDVPMVPVDDDDLRSSGRHYVTCPICAADFSSERHLSNHIDEAHC